MTKVGEVKSVPAAGRQIKRRRPFFRRIAACATALFLTFAPMYTGISRAQKTPTSQQSKEHQMSGYTVPITNGKEIFHVFLIDEEQKLFPSKAVEGPKNLTVSFYPIIELKKVVKSGGEIPVRIKYSLEKDGGQKEIKYHDGKAGNSNFEILNEKIKLPAGYVIGTPLTLRIPVPKGEHTFSAFSWGFARIVSIDPIIEKKKPPKPVVKKALPKPAPIKEVPKSRWHLEFEGIGLEAERVHLHEIGPAKNSGDINQLLAIAQMRLRRQLALNAGVYLTSFGLKHEAEEADTYLRSVSANAVAGVAYSHGKNTAFARAFGGYRLMLRDISSKLGNGSDLEATHGYELGGQAGYSYGHLIHAVISGSNNPSNPASLRASSVIPLWFWGKGIYPSVEVQALLLHSSKSLNEAERIGGINLNVKNAYIHVKGTAPIWKVWHITPSLLVAGDTNISEEGYHHSDFQVGLSALLEMNKWTVEAGGAISPISVTPLFLLKAEYKR